MTPPLRDRMTLREAANMLGRRDTESLARLLPTFTIGPAKRGRTRYTTREAVEALLHDRPAGETNGLREAREALR